MKNRIIIIGAGGHGKVVCEAILAQDKYQIIGFSDSNIKIGTPIIGDYKVIISQSNLFQLKNMADFFIIAIGNNKIRESVFSEVKTKPNTAPLSKKFS